MSGYVRGVGARNSSGQALRGDGYLRFRGASNKTLFETNSPHSMQVLWGEFVWVDEGSWAIFSCGALTAGRFQC